jgi:hypothetical protein
MMVINASTRPASRSPLVGRASREKVVGTPLPQDAFAIADAAWTISP